MAAAYREQRRSPSPGFAVGRTYPYPTGETPKGAQCLHECGRQAAARALRHGATLWRGDGHARADATPAGVTDLHDMDANVWEWVDDPASPGSRDERLTRGGSWWYGAAQMRADHVQRKPGATAVVYIGFRCASGP